MTSSSEVRSRVVRSAADTSTRVRFDETCTPAPPSGAGLRTAMLARADAPPEAPASPADLEHEWQEARRSGYETGLLEGQRDGALVLERAAAALNLAAQALDAQRRELVVMTEERLARAAFHVAEAIVGHALATDDATAIVRRALALAPEGDATVRVSPDDAESLALLDLGRVITVVADPTVSGGGCIVTVGATLIDARIDAAIERVREVLAP